VEEDIHFKGDEPIEETAPAAAPAPAAAAPASIEGSNIELKVMRPATFADVSAIADNLIEGCTVVLNLELLDQASTLRMLDFLNGVTYSTDGEIKNVSKSTYIITPNNVDVSDH
jgi:cell division inhibitor SepF